MKKRAQKIPVSEKYIQPGYTVKIKQEPPRSKITRFLLNTVHPIQKPPENGLNSHAGVWLKDKRGRLRYVQFPFWKQTGVIILDDPGTNVKVKRKKRR
jgi:hypothetical protein